MISGSEVSSEAPTDRLVAELDETQTALNEGPCVAALREHHTVHNHDMATDTRWPRFAQAAIERGVHSPLSFQLSSAMKNLSALNLYGDQPGVFSDDSIVISGVLAQDVSGPG